MLLRHEWLSHISITQKQREFVLSKQQVLRSGTSVGTLVCEAEY
jgi:hypothetical protein